MPSLVRLMEPIELDRRLQQLAEDRRRRDKLRRDEQHLREQISGLQLERFEFEEQVVRASEDLRRLEAVGIYSLFRMVLGDRADRIDAERERLLHARLRHDECDESLARLGEQRDRLQQELAEFAELDREWDELLAHKERALREAGGEAAARLVASSEALGELRDQRGEVDEAIAAGHRVMAELKSAEADLRGARSWGRLDMFGGGLLTSMAKHSNVDRAKRHVEQAQRALHDFVRELRDVQATLPVIEIDIGCFLKFADHFLDGLIVDWFVQRRIVTAQERVREVANRVFDLLMGLERRAKELRQQHADADLRRREWLENAGG